MSHFLKNQVRISPEKGFMMFLWSLQDTWLNENSLLILIFFSLLLLYFWRKANFLIMELIVSFPDDIEVSSGQLKRFNKSVIDQKCLLKVEATSSCFDDNLSFSSNVIFSCVFTIFI